MTNQLEVISHGTAYRWLAQFFLSPLSLTTLENYRTQDGQQFLIAAKAVPALAPVAEMVEKMVAPEADLTEVRTRFVSTFSQAFDVGGPRSAPPYASVYLSERGLLYQEPTRDMNRILYGLQMTLPDGVNEPADHIGIQLHVAAELCGRTLAEQPVPISCTAFLDRHVLSWLPAFVDRCEKLSDPATVYLPALAALEMVRADVNAGMEKRPDRAKVVGLAKTALSRVQEDIGTEDECQGVI